MKCCVSTDVGTWTNWLTFEPDPDYCPDAETGLLSLIYKHTTRNFTWEKSHIHVLAAWFLERAMVLFTELLDNFCWRYMRSTECRSSSFVCLLFVCRQCVLIGYWPDWPSSAIMLAAVIGCWASQASSGGAYWVGHSDHTDLLYLWQNIYFIAYCVPVCVTVCAIVLIQLLAAKTQ